MGLDYSCEPISFSSVALPHSITSGLGCERPSLLCVVDAGRIRAFEIEPRISETLIVLVPHGPSRQAF